MQNLRQQLPPLTALVVFEAAARHLSFTAAAGELNITQAAVSRQIRSLEANLQVALFTRQHRRVELTDAGKKLLRTVTISLEYLLQTVNELRGTDIRQEITVVATHAVASFCLIPRLAKFRQFFPDCEVHVFATDQELEQVNEAFDVAIRYGSGLWPGFTLQDLGQSEIFPVCSADYLHQHPFSTVDELIQQTLLMQHDFRWDWLDWPIWLAECGLKNKLLSNKLQINSYPLLIQAALNGQGVALGWHYLINDYLSAGSLVKPVDISLPSHHHFYLAIPENKPVPALVEEFCRWIMAELNP